MKAHGGFGFTLGRYDRSRELVIDPLLVYSKYYGGTLDENVQGIAVDSQGNAYIAGYTFSGNLPTTAGSFRPSPPFEPNGGGITGFVAKFNAAGTQLIYATYLAGFAADPYFSTNFVSAIAVDSSFNAYITGVTSSANFPLKNPVQSVCGPANNIGQSCQATPYSTCVDDQETDMFVLKLDSTGAAPIYSTYLGGSGDDGGTGITVNAAGEAFVVGYTQSNIDYESCGRCPTAPADRVGYPTTASAYLGAPVITDQACKVNSGGYRFPVLTKLSSSGPSATFSWPAISGATQYWLDVGTLPYVGNVFGGSVGTNTSKLVTGLPADGRTVYLTIYTQLNGSYFDSGGAYLRNSYTYTAGRIGAITSPAPSSTLSGATVTWSAYWEPRRRSATFSPAMWGRLRRIR